MASAGRGPEDSRSPYRGSVRRMVRDGFGQYLYQNTFFRYEGEWKDGKKHGHGKLLFKDGSYYEGEFVDGEIIGKGQRYWSSSGNTYSGEFFLGELQGHGIMMYKDGGKYEGEFSHGAREGHGTLIDKNGQFYQGSFHENKKHGVGQMTFNNGDTYDGDWVRDRQQGRGLLRAADGSRYQGQWRNGIFNGQGLMIHCSGIIYDGLWINGYPATEASKIVILGPNVIKVVQGSSFTLKVQLQTDDGEVVKSESGRALKIRAGVRYVQLPTFSTFSFFKVTGDAEVKPIQTPFGFECISYPLMYPVSKKPEPEPEKPEIEDPKLECSEDAPCSPKEDLEPECLLKSLLYPAKDDSEDLNEPQLTSSLGRQTSPHYQQVSHGLAVFHNISFPAPPPEYQPIMFLDSIPNKKDQEPQATKCSEKLEKVKKKDSSRRNKSPTQQIMPCLDQPLSSSDTLTAYPGEYVIMVQETTTPPFLGKTLPTAFAHVEILPSQKQQAPKDSS
ncbi:MORN repeat-containing protein 1 isoform X2 [Macrotis lagotis]|uniref:MORN repeat-containing protein 1 isoform X2 n=1 Tax=Macrotis lagotis TaxID=92651 RepID=UPI003D68FCB6